MGEVMIEVRCVLADGTECPVLKTCLARLNDPSIIGCDIPLYMAGLIPKEAIMVTHQFKPDAEPVKRGKKRKKVTE